MFNSYGRSGSSLSPTYVICYLLLFYSLGLSPPLAQLILNILYYWILSWTSSSVICISLTLSFCVYEHQWSSLELMLQNDILPRLQSPASRCQFSSQLSFVNASFNNNCCYFGKFTSMKGVLNPAQRQKKQTQTHANTKRFDPNIQWNTAGKFGESSKKKRKWGDQVVRQSWPSAMSDGSSMLTCSCAVCLSVCLA